MVRRILDLTNKSAERIIRKNRRIRKGLNLKKTKPQIIILGKGL